MYGKAGAGELASERGAAAPISFPRQLNVIHVGLRQSTGDKKYQTPAIYIAERATWNISAEAIPNEPERLAEWQNTGQGL